MYTVFSLICFWKMFSFTTTKFTDFFCAVFFRTMCPWTFLALLMVFRSDGNSELIEHKYFFNIVF